MGLKLFWQKLKMFFSDAEKVALASALIDLFVAVVTTVQVLIKMFV